MTRRSFRKTSGGGRGNVRIRLLSGRRLTANINGPPPPTLKIVVPPEEKPIPGVKLPPGRTALCRRVDLEEYVEMGPEDLRGVGPPKTGEGLDKQPLPL